MDSSEAVDLMICSHDVAAHWQRLVSYAQIQRSARPFHEDEETQISLIGRLPVRYHIGDIYHGSSRHHRRHS